MSESFFSSQKLGLEQILRLDELGPFDIIGDVHGCLIELRELLAKLGYQEIDGSYYHPEKRRVIFLGDLVNKGPDSVGTVHLVSQMVKNKTALYIRGNHCHYVYGYFMQYDAPDHKRLRKWLTDLSPDELTAFRAEFCELVEQTPPYMILDNGDLVVAHAGIEEHMIGKFDEQIFDFCLYGENTGELDVDGSVLRRDWAATYYGKPFIAYGHNRLFRAMPEIVNNTVNLDQSCAYGGWLGAMRYPEKEFVQVKAKRNYTD